MASNRVRPMVKCIAQCATVQPLNMMFIKVWENSDIMTLSGHQSIEL
jgi:hypothetical protein